MERLWNSSVCAYSSHLIIFLSLSGVHFWLFTFKCRKEPDCKIRIEMWDKDQELDDDFE
jgi:hypothetical protein